ncbi:MAG: DNA-directed RNA polymerase, subunit E'' [Desulfurococcus sp.]|nr:DNA-directed RNA polymerase, subunit E'' [Desulfurococcus sp.]
MSSRSKPFKACRKCRALVPKDAATCPVCGSRDFTFEWSGVVIVFNPEKSAVAKTLGLETRGKYVVKIE